ncbi:hypothetical protein BVRB_3g060180 [Beta vulgaris subsp. vulgaris]|nr:hypothetical protein BVRB_3g060180 [Beta vulgaris subsp. vulgaris]
MKGASYGAQVSFGDLWIPLLLEGVCSGSGMNQEKEFSVKRWILN